MRKKTIFKKFILGILVFLFILPLFIKPASAFETPNSTYQFQFEEALSSGEMNLQSFVNETLKAIMGSINHAIFGIFNFSTVEESESFDLNQNQKLGLVPGLLLFMGNIYANPPASAINYFANIGRDLKIISPAHAQEAISGFKVFEPVQQIWKTFRNLSYLLFVLILIGMGFAIMFRLKISPQAVITIQAALPKIIIGLILITFSYAIVGMIFDVVVFLNKIIDGIFITLLQDPNLSWAPFRDNFLTKIVQGLWLNVFERDVIMGPPTHIIQQAIVAFMVFYVFVNFLIPILGLLLGFIATILIVIALLRCLWVILKAFTMVVINLIFAPLRILIGVLPGNNGIADWFKDLISNAVVLPMMLVFFAIASYLIFAGAGIATSGDLWKGIFAGRPLLPSENLIPLTVNALLPFCGIALLLMAPKVSDIIQSAIAKKPFQYGTAIGEYGAIVGRIGQAGWGKLKEETGMGVRAEAKRKWAVEEEVKKLRGETGDIGR